MKNTEIKLSVFCIKPGQWQFFACKFPYEGIDIDIHTIEGRNAVETKDFRLQYVTTHVQTQSSGPYLAISEDVLTCNGTDIPINEAIFYCDDTAISGDDKVYFEDVLRYKLMKAKHPNSKEFYYNKSKSIKSNVSSVTLSGSDNNLDNYVLRKLSYTSNGKLTTSYNVGGTYLLNICTLDENGKTIRSISYDDNLDVVYEYSEKVGVRYHRKANGLVYKQDFISYNDAGTQISSFSREFNYNEGDANPNNNYNRLVSTKDEFGNVTEYTTDDVWGVITEVEMPDGSKITDTYDPDKCTLTSRLFSHATDPRSTIFDFSESDSDTITHGNANKSITFGFEYEKGKLSSVSKQSNQIEKHEHTDTTLDSYYPSDDSSKIYSTECTFDKYGRLTEIENVLENCYDIYPFFATENITNPNGSVTPAGTLIANANNGAALLAMSTDKLMGETARYTYDEKLRLKEIIVSNSNNYSNNKRGDTFEYDDIGRLTQSACMWDINADNAKCVGSEIEYTKEATDPTVDGKMSKCTYTVGNLAFTDPAESFFTSYETTNTYGAFNAISSKSHSIGGRAFTKSFEYDKTRVKKLTGNHGGTLQYEYDAMGRISKEKDSGGNVLKAYTYDSFGQLEWETNYILDKTFQYVYNEIGNLTSVTTYPHVNGVASATGTTKTFTYDGTNPDRLTGYNGKTVPYNSIGYPTTYNGYTLTWTKGKLTRMNAGNRTSGMTTYSYAYNALGQRVSKSFSFLPGKNDSGATLVARMLSSNRNYYYDHSGRLISEKFFESYENGTIDNTEITYLYDESSMIGLVFNRNGSEGVYYYHRNLQGDVIGIYDTNGTKVVEYAYDAWGNCSTTSATTNYPLASANPFRYRGYYFDVETSWYFLNARYYNPEWRRFISPENVSALNPEVVNGLNLFNYANNNPVNILYITSAPNQNYVNIGGVMISPVSSTSAVRTTFFNGSEFVFPTLSFNALLKNTILSLSEVSGTLFYSFTKNGRTMISYHQIFDGSDGFTVLDSLPHPVNTFFKGVGISLLIADTVGAGFESFNSGHSFGQGVLNVALTGGKNYVIYQVSGYVTVAAGKWVGAKLGASIGSSAGPVGVIVGVAAGTLVGDLIDEFGDAIIDWIVDCFD